jgi:hypothetical protein
MHGNTKHGKFGTPVYRAWGAILQRCLNPKYHRYKDYGGRGILVCERWLKFENFYADMGDPPAVMSIERKQNDKGYEPGNCVWATAKQQSDNRRNVRMLTYQGQTLPLKDWGRALDIPSTTIHRYVVSRGMTLEEAHKHYLTKRGIVL